MQQRVVVTAQVLTVKRSILARVPKDQFIAVVSIKIRPFKEKIMKYVAPQMKVFDINLLNENILAAACSGYCEGGYTSCPKWCNSGFSST